MTRRQQLTPATKELHQQDFRLNRSNPEVAKWADECGLASGPVAIKLTGENEQSVTVQIQRLNRAFGSLITFSLPRRDSRGVAWVAYGTLLA